MKKETIEDIINSNETLLKSEASLIAYFKENGYPEHEAKDIFRLLVDEINRNIVAKYTLPGVNPTEALIRQIKEGTLKSDIINNALNKIAKLYD